ncbi:hypothetical protein AB4Y86_14720 [Arthrobacter sp. 2YAF22_2]|uniref:hypothetical protein n=1 Tax=Arthrobacter sp. 2YAF22_2 TaxID=3233029 RepID=UPI003F9051C4
MSATYTVADLAAAWESGYWHGKSHEGPLNDAAVAAKNPHRNGNSSEGKESYMEAGLNMNTTGRSGK